MITGHLGATALVVAASRVRVSALMLATLIAASLVPDLVDIAFALGRVCSPYGLYSHTINAMVLETAVVGGAVWLATESRTLTVLFVTVLLLHIPADYITGLVPASRARPDSRGRRRCPRMVDVSSDRRPAGLERFMADAARTAALPGGN